MKKSSQIRYATYHIYKNGKSSFEITAVSDDVADIKKVIDKRDDSSIISEDGSEETENHVQAEITKTSEYGNQIWSIFENISGYYELLLYFTDVLPALGQTVYQSSVIKYAQDNFELHEEYDGFPIYKHDTTEEYRISRVLKRVRNLDNCSVKIKSSILLSLVATYDAVFSDYCKFLLKENPEKYEGSDKRYSVEEILSLSSIDEIFEKVIEDEIESIMIKSHTDQMKFFEKNFNIDFAGNFENWPIYIEIFERRNLAAHGNLLVNKRYLTNCKAAGLDTSAQIGESLVIDRSYMRKSVDTLLEVSILIAFATWRKRRPDELEQAFSSIVNITFELLKDGHPGPALRLADYALTVGKSSCDRQTYNMILINKCIALKKLKKEKECSKILTKTDWSGSSPIFKLAVAAVKGDVDETIKYIEPARVADNLDMLSLREWPLFSWVRDSSEFQDMVFEVFEEPFVKAKAVIIEDAITPDESISAH